MINTFQDQEEWRRNYKQIHCKRLQPKVSSNTGLSREAFWQTNIKVYGRKTVRKTESRRRSQGKV